MRLFITGGLGFIASNMIHYLLNKYDDIYIINYDKATYAANINNIQDVRDDPRHQLVIGDIADERVVEFWARGCDAVINFAAETHVDNSIKSGKEFIHSNVMGVQVLLDIARGLQIPKFIQISTDEVYGSWDNTHYLGEIYDVEGFPEYAPLMPSSPYSASKAGGDLLALAHHKTYGTPVMITRCTNNYGPRQHPEKLIPKAITNILQDIPVPIYGQGKNKRDWIHVEDHCRAIDLLLRKGEIGEIYNIGTGNHWQNIALVEKIIDIMGKGDIELVEDRPGHDWMYAVDTDKIRRLGWEPENSFVKGLKDTVEFYMMNEDYWKGR